MTKVLPLPDPMAQRSFYEIFEEFTAPPQLLSIQNVPTDLAAGADQAALAGFSPGVPYELVSVYITGQSNSAAVADGDTSVWVVTDSIGERFNTTFNSTTAFPVLNVPTALTEVVNTTASQPVSTGYAALAITNGANANTPVTIVTYNYYDYNAYPNPNWALIATNNGYAAIADGVKGVMTLSASDLVGVADNDEIYFVSNLELFLLADAKPLVVETTLTLTEANTDDANLMFGLMDGVAANSLLDDGGGPKASYSGAVIYKVDGGTKWVCESSLAGAQSTNTSSTTRTSATAVTLRIQLQPTTSTNYVVTYFADGEQLRDTTTGSFISHNLTLTSATEMQFVVGLKNGSAAQELVALDRCVAAQLR